MWLIQTKHVAGPTYSLVQRVKDLMRMWEKKNVWEKREVRLGGKQI